MYIRPGGKCAGAGIRKERPANGVVHANNITRVLSGHKVLNKFTIGIPNFIRIVFGFCIMSWRCSTRIDGPKEQVIIEYKR